MSGLPPVLGYYAGVLKHIETLRFEIDERKGQYALLERQAARQAVDSAIFRGQEAFYRSRPAVPVTPEAVEFLEEKRATDSEGTSFALGFPLLRDPARGILRPVWVIPVETLDDGQGNLRLVRAFAPIRGGGAGPQFAPGAYWREAAEEPLLEGLLRELGLPVTGDWFADLAAAAEAAAEGTALAPVRDAAALYAYIDADFMFNLRKDYEELSLDRDTALPALLDGAATPLKGAPPLDASIAGIELTPSQRAAVERIYSQRVTPIEGPPGTGKTTLIVNLCARTIVGRARRLAGLDGGRSPSILVTSTNNKAVRNVVEAFAAVAPEEPHAPGLFGGGRREIVAESVESLAALLERMDGEGGPSPRARESKRRLAQAAEPGERFRAAREYLYWRLAETGRHAPLGAAVRAYRKAREKGSFRRFAGLLEEHDALEAFFDVCPVLTCTTLSVRNVLPAAVRVELAVIDEAAQTMLPYSVPVLARARRAAAIGDENQLRPILDLPHEALGEIARDTIGGPPEPRLEFGGSTLGAVWERDRDRAVPGQSLKEHFRCREPIIRFCDRVCGYGLEVRTPDRGLATELGLGPGSLLETSVVLLDVPSEHHRAGGSYRNEKEAGAALEYLRRVWWTVAGRLNGRDLRDVAAVITPYRAQAWLLRSLFRHDKELGGFVRRGSDGRRLTLGTVHALQGDEKPVVVLSMTIAKGEGGYAFVNESPNLLNVAVSRARQQLAIAADAERLASDRGPWTRELWRHFEELEASGRARRIEVRDLADPRLWK
jgi:hypothetical protein